MNITGVNNGSLREVMDASLHNLRNAEGTNYLTAKLSGKVDVVKSNKRGFVWAIDFTTNPTGGYFNPAGGNLPTTASRNLDRITSNYQYVAFGEQLDNENLSQPGSTHVGPKAKALSAKKVLARRLEFEEWYFCRGDGSQVIADITAGVSIAAAATGTITCSGARDGAGAWMIRVGQRIRIYDVTLATLRSVATVTAKASNTSFSIVPDSALTAGNAVVDTDVILPEGDTTSPTTTGIKGLPYLATRTSGAYFDKTLSAVTDLQPTVDSSTTTFSRTTMEYLYRQHNSIRNNGGAKTVAVASPAQCSNYFTQFFAQSGAQVNIASGGGAHVDLGADMNYTQWGQRIQEYNLIHPKYWHNLDFSSFARLTVKEAGAMLTPAGEFIQKIQSGAYVNAQQRWDDDYLEYVCLNPAKNSAFSALTFTGLPLLRSSASIG